MRKPIIPLDKLSDLIDKGHTYSSISKLLNVSKWCVMQDCRYYGIRSKAGNNYTPEQRKKMSEAKKASWANGDYKNRSSLSEQVREQISNTVKRRWAEDTYKERINGMLGVTGVNHDKFKQERHYRDKLIYYTGNEQLVCSRCGKPITETKIDIHHVDENHDNILLSNLEPLCVKCHQLFHYKYFKTPYTTVTCTFRFDSAHYLPNHHRKCKFLHGHSYKLEVTVRRRVDPETGMVVDFGKLKNAVKTQIEEVLDHGYVNNFIPMPTSENMVLWIWMQLSFDVKGLYKLRLYETENNYSEITQEDVLEFAKSYDLEADWLNDEEVLKNYVLKQNALAWLQIDENEPNNPSVITCNNGISKGNVEELHEKYLKNYYEFKKNDNLNKLLKDSLIEEEENNVIDK